MRNAVLFFVALFLGIAFMLVVKTYAVKSKPQLDARYENTSSFSLEKAPKNSLTGKIIDLSGDVALRPRTSTEAAKITTPREIIQGESLNTTSGNATVQFQNIADIKLSSNSELDFVQTLPSNFVFNQTKGIVEYNKIGEAPISARIMHLLVNQDSGSMLVAVNPEENIITIDVLSGKITIAFNDLDYNSNVLEIFDDEKLIFNDLTREAEVE